jgi:hypothetical protein
MVLLTCKNYVDKKLLLPYGPVQNIKLITLENDLGAKILNPKFYDLSFDYLHFKTNIISPQISIYYQAGYTKDDLPESIKLGMLIHASSLFESRTGDIALPNATKSLYQPYCKIGL